MGTKFIGYCDRPDPEVLERVVRMFGSFELKKPLDTWHLMGSVRMWMAMLKQPSVIHR